MLNSLIEHILGLLFPDRCGGCARLGSLLCAQCRNSFQSYPASPFDRMPASLTSVTILYLFNGPLRQVVHRYKYHSVRRLAQPLGGLMAEQWQQRMCPVDALIAVPLHHTRLAERGFNQAEELARVIAGKLRIPLLEGGLVRIRATAQQARLDAKERARNMQGAFVWQSSTPPAHVLLIDDILTTGATMGACADVLRAAGAQQVSGLVLARTRPDSR
jgi:ComF family protein